MAPLKEPQKILDVGTGTGVFLARPYLYLYGFLLLYLWIFHVETTRYLGY